MAISAFGAVLSYSSSRKQSRAVKQQVAAQQEQQRLQKRSSDIKAQRERRKLVQEQLRAKSLALVASGEQCSDSRTAGVLGSVGTQAASAVGFAGQQQQIAGSIFEQGLIASSASSSIASAQATGQIGGSLMALGTASRDPSVKSIFGG